MLCPRASEDADLRRVLCALSVAAGLVLAAAGAFPTVAAAQAAAPQWTVGSVSRPTGFAVGAKPGEDAYLVTVTNTGGAPADGETSPIVITDELPAGLAPAPGASGEDELGAAQNTAGYNFSKDCEVAGEEQRVSCTYGGVVQPGDTLVLRFPVLLVASGPAAVTNVVRVAGGGAPGAPMQTPTSIYASEQQAAEATPFGLSPGGATTALSSVQAGAHPDLTVSAAFNTLTAAGATAGNVKDTTYDLPAGFAADLLDTPACQAAVFLRGECPIPTQIGVTTVTLDPFGSALDPVYNLAPEPGQVAKLGFGQGATVYEGDISVRPPGGPGEPYGARTTFYNVTAGGVELDDVSLTIWGVPASPHHDPLRWIPDRLNPGTGAGHFGGSGAAVEAPYFTNPTSCGAEPLQARFTVTSWQHPDPAESPPPTPQPFGPMVGCDGLSFEPTLEAKTNSNSAETATGLEVKLGVPQTFANPEGLATPHLDDSTVTLPAGMSLNPSAGSGLGSCTEAQFAYEGTTAEPQAGQGCPNESKVGVVEVISPVLAEKATGSLFVATPHQNPFNSLLALYLVARIPNRGVVVTAAGEVHADPATGQLTTTFDESAQLPFSELKLSFHQGATSPLITPPTCGTFTTDGVFTPWSAPAQEHLLSSEFEINHGVNGGPCPSGATPPFHPGLTAGSVNNAAGAYSPFYIRLSREDGEQEITHFSIKLPPGLSGKLAGVAKCSDAQIAAAKSREHEQGGAEEEAHPSCPAASEIGHTLVEAGVGTVLAQAPGKLYLAGPYKGSQISIVSITAAKVGPFDLGTVVIREGLKVDPETAQVSVDAAGSDPIPHIIDGIPVHARDIRIYVDRPGFALNPTSCEPTTTASTVLGSGKDFTSEADDRPVTVTSPFQAADCAALGFKPKLQLQLKGKTKRGGLPKLTATVTYPKEGSYANIAKTVVTLPPSEFLEQGHIGSSCTRVQFNAGGGNGEQCPAKSILGKAKAITPLLDEPLEGLVYLRSNGGERKLPDLVAALHSEDIDINLVGFIDSFHKKGSEVSQIRNSFAAVPDAPVSKFTLELFGGKKGLLVNSTNICKGTHKAISEFTGQNGKLYDTKPAVEAQCGKKGKKHTKKHKGHAKKSGGRKK